MFLYPSVVVKNLTDSLREGDRTFFDFGDGKTADTEEVVHEYDKDGQYTVKVVAVREFCVTEKSVTMPFFTLKVPNVITPDKKDGRNDRFKYTVRAATRRNAGRLRVQGVAGGIQPVGSPGV